MSNVTNRAISVTVQNMLEKTKCQWQGHRGQKHYGISKIQAEVTYFWLGLSQRFLNKSLALILVLDISFLTGEKKNVATSILTKNMENDHRNWETYGTYFQINKVV